MDILYNKRGFALFSFLHPKGYSLTILDLQRRTTVSSDFTASRPPSYNVCTPPIYEHKRFGSNQYLHPRLWFQTLYITQIFNYLLAHLKIKLSLSSPLDYRYWDHQSASPLPRLLSVRRTFQLSLRGRVIGKASSLKNHPHSF
ncbi:hypothetical protein YC2023_118321 [Brassica napus]